MPIETRVLLAVPDGSHLRVHGVIKDPLANHLEIARVTGLAPTSIDLPPADVGGSFGVKGELYPEDLLVPLLAVPGQYS